MGVQLNMEYLWPVSIESFKVSYKYLSVWSEPERGEIILQIKLAQWSLIKIIFLLEGSPTLTSIYVLATPSKTALIAKRHCTSKRDLRAATDLT